VPGTINHKPEYDAPRIRLLSDNGPVWTRHELECQLPELKSKPRQIAHRGRREEAGTDFEERKPSKLTMQQALDKIGVSKGWQRHFLRGQIGKERRHRMHWKLACKLRELGATPEDAFVPLYETPWADYGTNKRSIWKMISKLWGDDA
jgi:hypothetical protein